MVFSLPRIYGVYCVRPVPDNTDLFYIKQSYLLLSSTSVCLRPSLPYGETGRSKWVGLYCRYKPYIASDVCLLVVFFFSPVLAVDVLTVLFLWHALLSYLVCIKETENSLVFSFSLPLFTKRQPLRSAVTGLFSLEYFLTLS